MREGSFREVGVGGARDPTVTEGERLASRRSRKARSGQNEAPDHGGTTGGFASVGGFELPHIQNVRPVRPLGQAKLGHVGGVPGRDLHAFNTLRRVSHSV
ncbi:hypothetical protein GCM10010310_20280 [Streptomyces violaceolatus]|uniref:Uncharacterized protein n=1 Tax=Streptomyces violaceolatus TaxID=67378 RepID=A0ABN3SGH7_9ACTN